MEHQVDTLTPDDDFALSGGPGQPAAMCARCKRILPLEQFKRKLTRAQSQARGYVGSIRLEIESSMCKECQPRMKSPSELTAKQITNRMASGDLHPVMGKQIIQQRKARVSARAAKTAQRAWDNARTAPWHEPISTAQAELTRLRQQEKYAKKATEIDLTFFVEYKLLLSSTIARMRFEKMRSCREPQFLDWQGFVDIKDYARLFDLWDTLPSGYRLRVKRPSLFSTPPGEARPCPPIKTLSTMPSPAQRLSKE
jgi:hypothetical protein